MIAKYIQPGEIMEYKCAEALKFGDVVNLGSRIGVAANNIAAGEVGSVAVVGVFDLPKETGEGAADIPCGTAVYWDPDNEVITATAPVAPANGQAAAATKIPAGYAWANADKSDNRILVKLQG